jgi:hypothetical protein
VSRMNGKDLERLRDQFRELARDGELQEPLPRLEAFLRERFRVYHRRRRRREILRIGSIAACMTILFAGATVLVRRSVPTVAPAARTLPTGTAPVSRMPEPRPGLVEAPATRVRARQRPARPKLRLIPEAEREHEVMTSFIPVGLGVFGPGDRGSLIRVRLPRSALATFGLPVNENRAADVVNADVLLGEDGLARAIRFVQ